MNTVSAVVLAAVALLLIPSASAARLRAVTRVDRPPPVGSRRTVALTRLRLPWRVPSHGTRHEHGVHSHRDGALVDSSTRSGTDTALIADLLGACLTAGLPVPTAVSVVADVATGPIAEVLRSTSNALALGASAESAWRRARHHPDTAGLARAACRTASSGSALAEQAFALAERARNAAADRVEARAQRASVLVAGPLGLCFLPAFLCLGVIPVVLGLASRLTLTP
ncbi:type II secretion system F family protein [Saccharomonospora sp.]|uniref:type II secretion system F family protein n=1 Tax=Saccharomonospora sp. TaxID=33913 RepID=UPI0026134EAD|nr:type II secretion system F family protein [Saccharomonospora sp.]